MKYKSLRTKTLLAFGFLSMLSLPLNAQWKDNMGGNWNNPTSASLGNIINDRLWNRMRAKARARKNTGGLAAVNSGSPKANAIPPKRVAVANESSLKFRPTGTSLKSKILADELGSTAEERQEYFSLMNGVLKGYNDEAAKLGRPNDLSLALSFFLLTNTTVYHQKPEPTDDQILELGDAIAEILLEGEALKGVSDRQKQETLETLVLFTGIAAFGSQSAVQSGDAAGAKLYRQLAGQNLQTVLGISPDQITIGTDGISADSGADEGPAPAPSRNTTGRAMNSSAIPYLELSREYFDNEVGAQAKYDGKRLLVSGRVHSVRNIDGKIEVHFIDAFSITMPVNCYFPKSQATVLGKLKHKDEIVVEGTAHGSIYGGIVLEDCVLK